MTVLLGFAALVVDIGLNWATRTSAQTAADSAALAGASVLLVDGPAAAILEVQSLLADNIDGLTGVAGWATDGIEANGEVDCWTLPDDPPPTSEPCLDGSNALQVITPPIEVQYAFAPVLGKASNSIKALAAAGVGPAAPNNCVLCLLDTGGASRLAALGPGRIEAIGGGIAVNSDDPAALVSVNGDIIADQIRVVGGFDDGPGGGDLLPPPEEGGPPVVDPLSDLPTPDQLASPPVLRANTARTINTDTTLQPGIYTSVTVTDDATLTLDEGVYVFRTTTGLTIEDDATVVSGGTGSPSTWPARATRRRARGPGPGSGSRTTAGSWPPRRPAASTPGCRSSPTAATPGSCACGATGTSTWTGRSTGRACRCGSRTLATCGSTPCWWSARSPPASSTRGRSRSTTTRPPTSSGWPGRCSSAEVRAPPERERFVRTGWFDRPRACDRR